MSELFGNVLNASFQGSIVILVVLLARLVLKKAPKKYACLLWILVGVRLLCPFTFESKLSLQPDVQDIILFRTEAQPEPEIQDSEMVPAVPEHADLPEDVEIVYGNAFEENVSGTVEPERRLVIEWYAVCGGVWLVVAGSLTVYSLASYLLLKRRVREAVHLFDDVWECAGIDTAFILGFLHPRIYIPMGINEGSRRYILEHERRHLEHFDNWVKLIGFIALTVYWFNPLVWLAYVLLCRDMEMACDERVIRDMGLEERKRYSAALLECSANRAHWAACPVAFGEVSVRQRILSVLNYRKPAFWISVIAVIAVIFVAVCFLTNPTEQQVPAGDNEWENEIRAVLEEIQSRDYYYILEDRQFEGEYILNDSAQRNAFRSGDTWLRIDYSEDEGTFSGYMGIQGRYYDAVSDTNRFEWREVDMTENAIFDPWLYSFDIDAQEVTANAKWTDDNGYYIRLVVHAPYDQGWLHSEDYYVDFGFDSDGSFKHAIQYVKTSEMIDGKQEDHSMTVTMSILDIPEADIQSTIEVYAETLDRESEIYLGTASVDTPDWGLSLSVENVSSDGLTLVCQRSGGSYPGNVVTGRYWWVEKWVDGQWEPMETVEGIAWQMDALVIDTDAAIRWNCSFEWAYGGLEPGSYRIGKNFSNEARYQVGVPQSAEEITCNYYAQFEISE